MLLLIWIWQYFQNKRWVTQSSVAIGHFNIQSQGCRDKERKLEFGSSTQSDFKIYSWMINVSKARVFISTSTAGQYTPNFSLSGFTTRLSGGTCYSATPFHSYLSLLKQWQEGTLTATKCCAWKIYKQQVICHKWWRNNYCINSKLNYANPK